MPANFVNRSEPTGHFGSLPAVASTLRQVDRAGLLVVWLVCGFTFSLRTTEPDLWGHVQYGRDALREGLHTTTTYSFTAVGHRWINHENLSEVLFAWCVDHLGVASLLFGKCALGMLIAGVMMWRARGRGVSTFVVSAASLLICVNLIGFWQVRPQVLSYTFFAALLTLLSFCFGGWQEHWHLPWGRRMARADLTASSRTRLDRSRISCLGAAAVLFFLWVNTHGAFLAGFAVFGAYVAIRTVEVVLTPQLRLGMPRRGAVLRMLTISLVVGLATLGNPYGWKLHLWMLQSLTIPRPEIVEWHPLRYGDEPFMAFALLLVATVVGIGWSRRPLDATHLSVLGLTAWQALSHQRHIPFFVIACGFWMMPHWQSVAERCGSAMSHSPPLALPTLRRIRVGLLLVALVIGGWLVARCSSLQVPRGRYPVAALTFIHQRNLQGRMVVTYNWAQYVIAAFGDAHGGGDGNRGISVSFDGRFRTCYPLSLVDQHFDFILGCHPAIPRFRSADSPLAQPAAILERGDPDLVLISRYQPHSVKVMENQADRWTLLYQDQLAQIWGRNSKYANPDSDDYLPPAERSITNEPQRGYVAWPAFPPNLKPI